MEIDKSKLRTKSFFIALVYVGIATAAILCSYPPYYGDWVLIALIFTLPVSFLGIGIMYAGKYYLIVVIVQIFMFLGCWSVTYKYLFSKNKNLGNTANRR